LRIKENLEWFTSTNCTNCVEKVTKNSSASTNQSEYPVEGTVLLSAKAPGTIRTVAYRKTGDPHQFE